MIKFLNNNVCCFNNLNNRLFHSSVVLFSDGKLSVDTQLLGENRDIKLSESKLNDLKKGLNELTNLSVTELESIHNDVEKKGEELKVVVDRITKHNEKITDKSESLDVLYDTDENQIFSDYPWLCNEITKKPLNIDYSNLSNFEVIDIIKNYLNHRTGNDLGDGEKTKLTVYISEARKNLKNKNITVSDILILYKKFDQLQKLNVDNVSAGLSSSSIVSDIKNNLGVRSKNISDITLGDIGNFLMDKEYIKFIREIKNHVNVDVLTAGSNIIGYGLMLSSYHRLVYKAPIPNGLAGVEKIEYLLTRDRRLTLFATIIAPVTLFGLYGIKSLKTTPTVKVSLFNNNESFSNLDPNKGFLFFTLNLFKKFPWWILIILIISIILLYLIDFNFIMVMDLISKINPIYYKLFCLSLIFLVIAYNILSLIILYNYYNKGENFKIYLILPEFIQKWFKSIELFSKSSVAFKAYKDLVYREIFVYISIFIIVLIFM